MSSFNLRPHHALCIQNFRGRGYSPEFTENMTSVIQIMEQNNPQIMLVSETDILCSSCPHNQQGRCRSYSHVLELDKRFLQSCELHTETPITWQNLKTHAISILKNQHRFQKICHDCSWYEFCSSLVQKT
ncbi:MAG: DUF1284 domain-containing protein [Acutalibacteraceae bacterium]